MGLFNRNICPHCGEEYSALRAACPKCGTRKQRVSNRAAVGSDAVRRGSAAQARQQADSRWQTIFGLCLIAAVIIAVIVLVVTSVNGGYEAYVKATPTPSEDVSPSETPSPTPTPTPTPTVESVTITLFGQKQGDFAISPGDSIQFSASIYPVETEATVTWSTANPEFCKVDDNGLVTGVASGTTTLTATCFGASYSVTVWVR